MRQVVNHIHSLLPIVVVLGSLGLHYLLCLVLELDCNPPNTRGLADSAKTVDHHPHLTLVQLLLAGHGLLYLELLPLVIVIEKIFCKHLLVGDVVRRRVERKQRMPCFNTRAKERKPP